MKSTFMQIVLVFAGSSHIKFTICLKLIYPEGNCREFYLKACIFSPNVGFTAFMKI
jgi:hypothetical protein